MRKTIHSPEYDTLLELLREARERVGMTQEQLAEGLKSTQSVVSKCERGERRLDAVELWRWCQVLGLSYGDFTARLDKKLSRFAKR